MASARKRLTEAASRIARSVPDRVIAVAFLENGRNTSKRAKAAPVVRRDEQRRPPKARTAACADVTR